MIVEYKSNNIKKQCENPKVAQKEYGDRIGNKLTQRVGELVAATSLLDIKMVPSARLHRLKGNRSVEYAIDLVHPFRLIIKPMNVKCLDLNELDKITIVRIEEVIDYHGKQKRK